VCVPEICRALRDLSAFRSERLRVAVKAINWKPDIISTVPSTFGEKLKNALLPPKRYIAHRARKELRRGERELGLLPFLVDPTRVALDVGANKGVWTWWLAGLASQVYAYEPNPKLFNILRRNVAANVVAEQIALSDRAGTAELRVPYSARGYSNQGASLSATKVDGTFLGIEVETRRIDDLGLHQDRCGGL